MKTEIKTLSELGINELGSMKVKTFTGSTRQRGKIIKPVKMRLFHHLLWMETGKRTEREGELWQL